MTRRGFLTRIVGAAIALTLARHLPGIAPTQPPEPDHVSLRFIKDFNGTGEVTRIDVLYGWRTLRPDLAVRVFDAVT